MRRFPPTVEGCSTLRLPLTINAPLGAEFQARWRRDFESSTTPTSRDRTIEEGIWRRTQEPGNASESAWLSEHDTRRRIVHYHYKFGLAETPDGTWLVLKSLYLYQSLSLPLHELNAFHGRIVTALKEGKWTENIDGGWNREDLLCTVQRYVRHPEDVLARRTLPNAYESLDVTVESVICSMPGKCRRIPWEVLSRGIRLRDRRGEPTFVSSLGSLARFLPFQIELGCGISTEAGIPPLYFLHDLYSVTRRDTGAFIFGGDSDTLLPQVLGEPEWHLRHRAQIMHACLMAEPTQAHRVLQELADRRMLLTPIITNNFDGLPTRVGLDECYIRRYDEDVPEVPIYPEAKALLVIGSHADRRKVQARFRERGLPIFFLDPEGFHEEGQFVPYPIEGARGGDFIRHAGAAAGLLELAQELGLHAAAR